MNVFEFVLGIIVIGTVASLIRLRMGVRKDNMGNEHPIRDDSREAAAMREEMKQLRDRLAVSNGSRWRRKTASSAKSSG